MKKKLSKTGVIFFSSLLFIGLILAAVDCADMGVFIMTKAFAIAFILVSGEFLINSIDK